MCPIDACAFHTGITSTTGHEECNAAFPRTSSLSCCKAFSRTKACLTSAPTKTNRQIAKPLKIENCSLQFAWTNRGNLYQQLHCYSQLGEHHHQLVFFHFCSQTFPRPSWLVAVTENGREKSEDQHSSHLLPDAAMVPYSDS